MQTCNFKRKQVTTADHSAVIVFCPVIVQVNIRTNHYKLNTVQLQALFSCNYIFCLTIILPCTGNLKLTPRLCAVCPFCLNDFQSVVVLLLRKRRNWDWKKIVKNVWVFKPGVLNSLNSVGFLSYQVDNFISMDVYLTGKKTCWIVALKLRNSGIYLEDHGACKNL